MLIFVVGDNYSCREFHAFCICRLSWLQYNFAGREDDENDSTPAHHGYLPNRPLHRSVCHVSLSVCPSVCLSVAVYSSIVVTTKHKWTELPTVHRKTTSVSLCNRWPCGPNLHQTTVDLREISRLPQPKFPRIKEPVRHWNKPRRRQK